MYWLILILGGWMEDIRKVVAFDSVEEFWGLYNNIVPPSQLPGKANYYLFKVRLPSHWDTYGYQRDLLLTTGQHHASLGRHCE